MRRRATTRRAGKARRWLFWTVALVLVTVALLPTIVAKSSLRNTLLASLLSDDVVQVSVGGMSLGWLSPPSFSNVEVQDPAGQTLLTAERVRLERSPWELLQDNRGLGTIVIEQPIVYVDVRADGSNLEDLWELTDQQRDSEVPPESVPVGDSAEPDQPLQLQIVDGTLLVRDAVQGAVHTASQIQLQIEAPPAGAGTWRLLAEGELIQTAAQRAASQATGFWRFRVEPNSNGRQRAELETRQLPLAALAPWLRRWVSEPELAGWLATQAVAEWDAGATIRVTDGGWQLPAGFATSGQAVVEQLDFAAPVLLGDRLRMGRLEMPWQLALDGSQLVVSELRLAGELGRLAAHGTLDTATSLQQRDLELTGQLDLAKLANMLPRALQVQPGTRITAGDVQLALRSQPSGKGERLTGTIETSQLVASTASGPIRWDQPVRITFDATRTDRHLLIDQLLCDSDFCQVDASSDGNDLQARLQFDLDRLAGQLGQFVDLSRWQPAGAGEATLSWRNLDGEQFESEADFRLRGFRLASSGRSVWQEPQLRVRARAKGRRDRARYWPRVIEAGDLSLLADQDRLDATLKGAVDLSTATPIWLLSIQATGDAANWLDRIRPWSELDAWQLDGQLQVAAGLRLTRDGGAITDGQATCSDLRARGPGWWIDEPRFEIAGDLRWDLATGQLATREAQVISSSASLLVRDADIRLAARHLLGAAALRADLARVAAWRTAPDTASAWRPSGMLAGNVRFAQSDGRVTAEMELTGAEVALARRQSPTTGRKDVFRTVWQEPELRIGGKAVYDSATDRLSLAPMRIDSETVALTARGTVEQLADAQLVKLDGTADYDLAMITALGGPLWGDGLKLIGRERAQFQVNGSLAALSRNSENEVFAPAASSTASQHWSRELQARVTAPWAEANVYGLPIGPGQLVATLGDGTVQVEPLSFAVGAGKLELAPTVRLDPPPSTLTLAQGDVLTNVQISAEVSDAMLKYIAPVLAEATRSEGQFSLRLEGALVPLFDRQQADTAGQLVVHQLQVIPGPSTAQWVQLAAQIEDLVKNQDPQALLRRPTVRLLTIQQQSVNFRVVDGRVYHEGLEFYVGDVPVRSRGSVGLDETLQLTLEIPIQDAWLGAESWLAGLKGETLQVPISGSLTSPRVDRSVINSLTQRFWQGAAQDALGGELNRALEKLFGK